jgi:hypothetical protein
LRCGCNGAGRDIDGESEGRAGIGAVNVNSSDGNRAIIEGRSIQHCHTTPNEPNLISSEPLLLNSFDRVRAFLTPGQSIHHSGSLSSPCRDFEQPATSAQYLRSYWLSGLDHLHPKTIKPTHTSDLTGYYPFADAPTPTSFVSGAQLRLCRPVETAPNAKRSDSGRQELYQTDMSSRPMLKPAC